MKKKTILIIDDDIELRQELSEMLRSEGYLVSGAPTALNALEKMALSVPDLIIIDYKLPGMTGVELLKEIRKTNRSSKILIVSGKPFIEKLLEEEALAGTMSGVLNKPFEIDILLAKVKTLI